MKSYDGAHEPGGRNSGCHFQLTNRESSVLAYAGHLQQSIQAAQRASSLAQEAGHNEAAALYLASAAAAAGFTHDRHEAAELADAALKLSNDRGVEYGAALALALTGETARRSNFPVISRSASRKIAPYSTAICPHLKHRLH